MTTEKEATVSPLLQIGVSVGYMISSSFLTTVNKTLYEKYEFSSPLNVFMVQCLCNVVICMSMMSYKSNIDSNAFENLKTIGIRITKLDETASKLRNGLVIGSLNIVTVLFGLFSVKHVSIPLFLVFRRCAVVATIIVTFFVEKKYPE